MDPDADVDRAGPERLPALLGRGDRLARVRERVEERVALGVDLDAAVAPEASRSEPAVLSERLRVRLGAELVQQLVDPSMSVNTRVTIPAGRSPLTRHHARVASRVIDPTTHDGMSAASRASTPAGVRHSRLSGERLGG